MAGQASEQARLIERHRAEDRQFQGLSPRPDFDRAAEVEARRDQARGMARENERGGPEVPQA